MTEKLFPGFRLLCRLWVAVLIDGNLPLRVLGELLRDAIG